MVGDVGVALVEVPFQLLELGVDVVGIPRSTTLEIHHPLRIPNNAGVVDGNPQPLAKSNRVAGLSDRSASVITIAID